MIFGCVRVLSSARVSTKQRMKLELYETTVHFVTHVKISKLAATLQTSCEQVVFTRLVTSCQQVWNKLLDKLSTSCVHTACCKLSISQTCYNGLFQQGCYNHDITILLQPCVVNLVTFLFYHDCIRFFRTTL